MHEYGGIDIVMMSLNFNEELVASSIPVFDIKATLAVRTDLMTPPKTVAVSDLTFEFNKNFEIALTNGLQALAKSELQQNVRQAFIGLMY